MALALADDAGDDDDGADDAAALEEADVLALDEADGELALGEGALSLELLAELELDLGAAPMVSSPSESFVSFWADIFGIGKAGAETPFSIGSSSSSLVTDFTVSVWFSFADFRPKAAKGEVVGCFDRFPKPVAGEV